MRDLWRSVVLVLGVGLVVAAVVSAFTGEIDARVREQLDALGYLECRRREVVWRR